MASNSGFPWLPFWCSTSSIHSTYPSQNDSWHLLADEERGAAGVSREQATFHLWVKVCCTDREMDVSWNKEPSCWSLLKGKQKESKREHKFEPPFNNHPFDPFAANKERIPRCGKKNKKKKHELSKSWLRAPDWQRIAAGVARY